MTKGEAAALDNNQIVFPANFVQEGNETVLSAKITERTVIESGEADKLNIKIRFARLKKSLRKRSVSIL